MVRPPVLVSLGPHVKNACDPQVDPTDSATVLAGAKKRVGIYMPGMPTVRRRQFRRFVLKWCKKYLVPLDPNTDFSQETWLAGTNYPEWRKKQLRRAWEGITDPHASKHKKVKSFIKDETYPDFKHARTINSRTDEFKCLVGPYIKQVEKVLFKLPFFIKYVPMKDRAQALLERLSHKYRFINSTDFTSFEAHFVELLEDTEFILYEYMFSRIPDRKYIMKLLRDALLEFNVLVFKYLTMSIWRRRMSGEMSTSLGNGFANLMIILFIVEVIMKDTTFPYCEGDDGAFGTNKPCPSPKWLYQELGIKLKIETCEDVADASFCGNVFDPVDLLIVTDPISVMVNFGWTTSRYAKAKTKRQMELLRSKALSMIHQYPGCPVLSELAQYAIRMTSGYRAKPGVMNEYEREEFARMKQEMAKNMPIVAPPENTRKLVERKFKVSIADQLALEEYFRNKNDLTPIDHPCLDNYLSVASKRFFRHYSATVPLSYNLSAVMPPRILS